MRANETTGHSVVLVTNAPFPLGNVSTLRYTSYLKVLVEKEVRAKVVVFCPSSHGREGVPRTGEHKGIAYAYSSSPVWETNSMVKKLFIAIKGIIHSLSIIGEEQYDSLILYGENSFFVNAFYYLYCKFHKIRFFGDRSEYPSDRVKNSKIKMFFYKRKVRMFDGMIIMTDELSKYYSNLVNRKDFVFTLPMTIDDSRFLGVETPREKDSKIVVVFGGHNRDGLIDSVKAFLKYCEIYSSSLSLVLIGPFQSLPNSHAISDIINNSKYKERVIIKGQMPIDKVPYYLSTATCLLTTPTFYKSGGFPTKLGEYMLSKTPIVLTNAGEISKYVEADKDAIVCAPGDYDAIARGINRIEKDHKYAQYLISNAYSKVRTVFNAETYVDKLIVFLFKV